NFLAEVESFERPTVLDTAQSRTFSLSHMALQKRVNRAVRNAADQLEPYRILDIPLVVVLDNHRQVGISGPDNHALRSLFGELYFIKTVDTMTGADFGDVAMEHQDDGAPLASGARPYVSAVLVNLP